VLLSWQEWTSFWFHYCRTYAGFQSPSQMWAKVEKNARQIPCRKSYNTFCCMLASTREATTQGGRPL
jgi:hypothetical protein